MKHLLSQSQLIKSIPSELNIKFKKWFGKSKVVDDKGKPLIVYHGTNKKFNTFKKSKYGAMGSGIYLTTHKEVAEMHGDFVMELYAKIEDDSDGIIAGHEVIIYKPENIKSIYNNGSWDIDNSNIYL